jgi:hypothetical protein
MSIKFNAIKSIAALVVTAAIIPLALQAGVIKTETSKGFTFVNFDPSPDGALGSNTNGISNRGVLVGSTLNSNQTFGNFEGTPAKTSIVSLGPNGMALGTNSVGSIVGTDNGAAFFIAPNTTKLQTLSMPANATNAFGINDSGTIVGQYTGNNNQTPGFLLPHQGATTFIQINAPSGPNLVNAQSVNNFGLIVGFYQGTDGNVHGFTAQSSSAKNGVLTGTPVADPKIPSVEGEPGATFVFSQILSVNDAGIAVGYYGDSTLSQHGFIYNTNTKQYTFVDDPSEAFNNGVEVTQITGITDSGEIAGFYTDASGIAHSFTGCPQYSFCPNFPHVLPQSATQ